MWLIQCSCLSTRPPMLRVPMAVEAWAPRLGPPPALCKPILRSMEPPWKTGQAIVSAVWATVAQAVMTPKGAMRLGNVLFPLDGVPSCVVYFVLACYRCFCSWRYFKGVFFINYSLTNVFFSIHIGTALSGVVAGHRTGLLSHTGSACCKNRLKSSLDRLLRTPIFRMICRLFLGMCPELGLSRVGRRYRQLDGDSFLFTFNPCTIVGYIFVLLAWKEKKLILESEMNCVFPFFFFGKKYTHACFTLFKVYV